MTKSFKKLRNEMPASRQARIAARTDELLATLPLHEIRQARKLSQEELATRLHVNQAAVSKAERRTDLYISTLRKHIEAMGGTLVIQAEFPEGRYQLETFGGITEERADQGISLKEAEQAEEPLPEHCHWSEIDVARFWDEWNGSQSRARAKRSSRSYRACSSFKALAPGG